MRFTSICLVALTTLLPIQGRVQVLKDDSFEGVTKEGFWLVEFYAPWCGHCKKLNPILDEISAESMDKGMRIGKVDATSEKKTADRFGVEGYPTLKFRVRPDDEWRTYEGARKGVNLLAFADRMLAEPLPVIENKEHLNNLIERSNELGNGIIYLFGSPSDVWKQSALITAQSLQHKIICGVLSESALSSLVWEATNAQNDVIDVPFPKGTSFVASLEVGEIPRFLTLDSIDKDENNKQQGLGKETEEWILANNAPLFSEFGASNFRKLGKLGKLLVIAIVDPANETSTGFVEGVRHAARSVSAEKTQPKKAEGEEDNVEKSVPFKKASSISEQYVYGTLDGVHWSEFIEQFNIFNNELPRLVVLDMPKEVFFEDPAVDEPDEIDSFLHEVYDGKVPAQKEGLQGSLNRFLGKIKGMGWRFYIMVIPFALSIIGAFLVPTSSPKDKRN